MPDEEKEKTILTVGKVILRIIIGLLILLLGKEFLDILDNIAKGVNNEVVQKIYI